MVKKLLHRAPLLAFAVLIAAVGIGPRRDGRSREDSTSSPAPSSSAPGPSAAPSLPRIRIAPRRASPPPPVDAAPRESGPAASSPRAPIGPRTGISPRETRPGSAVPGRISGISPSAAGPVGIRRRESVEVVPRRHYWHEHGGRRYSHYFDGRVHWYGYPFGASFFWMRPWGGFWWAWDANFARWVYWHDGFWWWPGPGGIAYVYVYDGYYPYSAVRQPAYSAPPASPDASGAWTSPDGQRLVEVSGPDAQAVLFDAAVAPAAYIAFLGKDVRKIRFSAAAPGYPPTIAVEFSNGAAALFDYDGRRLDAAKPADVKGTPPPADIPPPPPGDAPPSP